MTASTSPGPGMLSRRAAMKAGVALPAAVAGVGVASRPVVAQPAQAGLTPDRVAEAVAQLPSMVREAMGSTGIPGVAVAVVYDDAQVYAEGFGVRDSGAADPVDADTVFQIASISKPVSSTVIAALVGEGTIAWDTKIADLDPAFALADPWVTANVTISDLFSHRSGLPAHVGDELEDLGGDRVAILHSLRHVPLAGAFRASYAYTNYGLTAAAEAVASSAGVEWETLVAERLFQRAGMLRTTGRHAEFVTMSNRAVGHVSEGGAWVHRFDRQPDAQSPAGGVSSSVNDLTRWIRLHLNGGVLEGEPIVEQAALEATYLPHAIQRVSERPARQPAGFYGLGWNVDYDAQGDIVLGHSGAFILGAATCVRLLPQYGLGIVVLTNAAPVGVAEAISLAFFDLCRFGEVRNDYLTIMRGVLEEALAPPFGQDVAEPAVDFSPPRESATYVGRYANAVFGELEVFADGSELSMVLGPAGMTFPIEHHSRDVFSYYASGETGEARAAVTFTVGADDRARRVVIENLDLYGMGMFVRIPEDDS